MKVFLRNTATGQFYAGPGQWTAAHSEAVDFPGPDVALDAVSETKLDAMEVVIHSPLVLRSSVLPREKGVAYALPRNGEGLFARTARRDSAGRRLLQIEPR